RAGELDLPAHVFRGRPGDGQALLQTGAVAARPAPAGPVLGPRQADTSQEDYQEQGPLFMTDASHWNLPDQFVNGPGPFLGDADGTPDRRLMLLVRVDSQDLVDGGEEVGR